MTSVVASRYARALAEVVFAPGAGVEPNDVLRQLRAVESLLSESHALHTVLLSPAVPPSKKRTILGRLIEPLGAARPVRNFLYVLIDRRRIELLPEIREAFEAMLDEHFGLIRADVTSASDLSESQRASLVAQLSRLSGKQVRPEFHVDASLLGGVTARVGSTVYDGSVRGELDKLRKRLAS